MPVSPLIAEIAASWARSLAAGGSEGRAAGCSQCASSDLVLAETAARWSHDALHRLVAPIEEVIDAEIEAFLYVDRDARLPDVDAYRARIRTAARAIVDRAVMEGRARLVEIGA